MKFVIVLLFICAAVGADGQINALRRGCAGTDMLMRCSASGRFQMTSFNITLYTSPSDINTCKQDEDLSMRRDLCREYANEGEIVQLIHSKCINMNECMVQLPSQIGSLQPCNGKAYFYGVQVDMLCTATEAPKKPSTHSKPSTGERHSLPQEPAIYKRSLPTSHSKDLSMNINSRRNSIESPSRNFKSTQSGRDQKSIERFRSKEDPRDRSRDRDYSDEFSRGGSSGGRGSTGGSRGTKSYDKNGYAIYSGTNAQLSSAAYRVEAILSTVLAFGVAIMLI